MLFWSCTCSVKVNNEEDYRKNGSDYLKKNNIGVLTKKNKRWKNATRFLIKQQIQLFLRIKEIKQKFFFFYFLILAKLRFNNRQLKKIRV